MAGKGVAPLHFFIASFINNEYSAVPLWYLVCTIHKLSGEPECSFKPSIGQHKQNENILTKLAIQLHHILNMGVVTVKSARKEGLDGVLLSLFICFPV